MNAVVTTQGIDPAIIANLVTTGDLSQLTPKEKVSYYNYRCTQAGLDPAAKPFDLLKLNGKLILYANATATQQLSGVHKLSTAITAREHVEDVYLVTARVTSPDGRFSENTGAVGIGGLKGDVLANAILKATTKAIRRTVLAHLGLGMLDETEVATIPGAATQPAETLTADPRGDLGQVDTKLRDKHVSAVTDILNMDAEEQKIADTLREYVAEFLQPNNELYISVADELQAQKLCSKSQLKASLKHGLEAGRR